MTRLSNYARQISTKKTSSQTVYFKLLHLSFGDLEITKQNTTILFFSVKTEAKKKRNFFQL